MIQNPEETLVVSAADLLELYGGQGQLIIKAYIENDLPSYQLVITTKNKTVARVKQVQRDKPAAYKQVESWTQDIEELGVSEVAIDFTDPLFQAVKSFKRDRAKTIKTAMKTAKVTFRDIATLAGVQPPTINTVIDGERRYDIEAVICTTLGLDKTTVFPESIEKHLNIS